MTLTRRIYSDPLKMDLLSNAAAIGVSGFGPRGSFHTGAAFIHFMVFAYKTTTFAVPIYTLLRLTLCHNVRFISPVPAMGPRHNICGVVHGRSLTDAANCTHVFQIDSARRLKLDGCAFLDSIVRNPTITRWKLQQSFPATGVCTPEMVVFLPCGATSE